MPRYLALDFASEATKYRQGFFNKFLLILPSCLEHDAENLANYSERLPWTQAKGQKIMWTSFSGIPLQEDIKQIPSVSMQAKQDLESFVEESVGPNEQDGIDKKLELEIVPSSNPDSPPVDSQTCKSIQSRFEDKTATAGVQPSEEAIPLLLEDDTTARFLLEDTFCTSVTTKSVSSKSCEELCKQLGKKTVKDPFADLPAQLKLEVLQPRDNLNATTTSESSTTEEYELEVDLQNAGTETVNKELMLPDVLTTPGITAQLPVISEILCHEEKLEAELQTHFDWSETDIFPPLENTKARSVETLPNIPTPGPDHVTLNNDEQTATGDDPFVSLESPTTPVSGTAGTRSTDQLEQQSKVPLTPTDCFGTTIVSPATKKRTEEQVWKSEQGLHDTVALSLKVTDCGITDISSQVSSIPVPHYTLSKERDSNDAELALPWQPLQVPPETMKRYNRSVENLEDRKGQLPNLVVESYAQEIQLHFLEVSIDDNAVDAPLKHIEVLCEKGQNMKDTSSTYSPDDVTEQKPDEVTEQKIPTAQRSDSNPIISHECDKEQKHPVKIIGSETSAIEMKDTSKLLVTASTTSNEASHSEAKGDDERGRQRRETAADPLADFLKLRNRVSGFEPRVPSRPLQPPHPPATTEATAGSTQTVTEDSKKELVTENADAKPTVVEPDTPLEPPAMKPENRKIKSRLVEVALTAPFLEMVKLLEEAANPVVSHLHKKGSLSPSYTFSNLTMDITRFLLVQHSKQIDTDNPETKEEFKDSYKHMILLHGYVTAANLITHCDAVTAIMHLGTLSETYHHILQGCMEQLRGALFKKQCLLPRNELHPKLCELAKLTGEWFQKKLKKEGRDHDPKVLVIVRRDSGKLAESISSVLSSIKGMSAWILESSPTTYTAISNMLEKHNALVATPSQIDESFPWAQFALVVEYEAAPKSPWKELCLRQRIRHIELRCVVEMAVAPASGCYTNRGTDLKKSVDDNSKKVAPLKLVGSEKITHSTTLLQLLETRHNVLIVERSGTYSQSATSPSSKLPRADLIIDERTGVILQEMETLLEDGSVEPLVRTITLLSKQFCVLWVILEGNSGVNRYSLGGKVVANTTKLHAALSQVSSKSNDFEVKVMYSGNSNQTAAAIESICSFSQQAASLVWHLEDWRARPWLVDRLTRHEEFLVQFPCLNSMSVQIMLTAAPLPALLTAPLKELVQLCPWIPRKMLESFYSIVHDVHPASITRDSQAHRDRISTRPAADVSTVYNVPVKEEPDLRTEIQSDFEREHLLSAGTDHLLQRAREDIWPGMLNQHRKEMHHVTVPRIKPEKDESFPYCQESTYADASMARLHVPDDLKTPLELIAAYETRTDDDNNKYNLCYDPWDMPEGYTDSDRYRQAHGIRLTTDEDGACGQQCNWPQGGRAESQELSQRYTFDQSAEGAGSGDAEVPHSATSRAGKPRLNCPRLDFSNSIGVGLLRDMLDETSKPHQQRTMQSLHHKHYKSRSSDHPDDEVELLYYGPSNRQAAVHARYADLNQHRSSYSKPLEGPPSMRHIGVAQPCPRAAPNLLEGGSCNKRTTRNTASHGWSQSLEDTMRATGSYPSHVWQDSLHRSKAVRESSAQQASWQNSECRPTFFRGAMSDRLPPRDFLLQGIHAQSTFGDAMTKKRRLTFEKVPGAKDGQTRLTFH